MSDKKTVADYAKWIYPGHLNSFISELFSIIQRSKDDEARKRQLVDWMRSNQTSVLKIRTLRSVLESFFLPEKKFDLPTGMPNNIMKVHTFPDQVSSSLYKVMGSSGYFIKGHPSYIADPVKREKVFIVLSESMNESELYLYYAIKDTDLSFVPGLARGWVSEAVPGWIPPLGDTNADKKESFNSSEAVPFITNNQGSGTEVSGEQPKVRKKPGPKPGAKKAKREAELKNQDAVVG